MPSSLTLQHQSPHRQAADELFPGENGPLFLGAIPWPARNSRNRARRCRTFSENTYALIAKSFEPVAAVFRPILFQSPKKLNGTRSANQCLRQDPRKNRRPPALARRQQHDYAVGLASHLPQLAAVALAGFLYDRLDENGFPSPLPAPASAIRFASPAALFTWRDIVLTTRKCSPPPSISSPAALTISARTRLPRTRSRLRRRQRTLQLLRSL